MYHHQPHIGAASVHSRGIGIALRHLDSAVVYQDRDRRVLWAENFPPRLFEGDISGMVDEEFLPSGIASQVVELKTEALREERPVHRDLSLRGEGSATWFTFWIDPDRGADGKVQGLVTTIADVTSRKRREEAVRSLMLEVSHRSKNLLAIIQSLAAQTGRYSGSIDSFLVRLRGRLQSLAQSQDLVTSSDWRGAHLHDLVMGQVGRHGVGDAVEFVGDNPCLSPNAALHIGLALHELAVNSARFGALSRSGGRVAIEARTQLDEGDRRLTIVWRESIKPGAGLQDKKFGSLTLERVVPAALNAQANLSLEGQRLEYRLAIPRREVAFD